MKYLQEKKNDNGPFKKYRWIVTLALCLAVGLVLFGWFNSPKPVFAPVKDYEPPGDVKSDNGDSQGGGAYVPDQLIGLFENEKQAKECAKLYGIKLESFSYGVAVFQVEGDPNEYIEKGNKNGWPELSLNYKFKAL